MRAGAAEMTKGGQAKPPAGRRLHRVARDSTPRHVSADAW